MRSSFERSNLLVETKYICRLSCVFVEMMKISTKQIHVSPSTSSSTPQIDLQPSQPLSSEYHPYIDEIEVGSVFSKIDQLVEDNNEDYRFMKFRVPFTFCAWISACVGIFTVIYGGAYTIAFQSVKKRFWLMIIGFVLCLPLILWFIFMFCASSDERRRRRMISKKRKIRLEVYAKNPEILKDEAKLRVKERVAQDKKEKEEAEKAIELERKRNPLNYPNKNAVTRHKIRE